MEEVLCPTVCLWWHWIPRAQFSALFLEDPSSSPVLVYTEAGHLSSWELGAVRQATRGPLPSEQDLAILILKVLGVRWAGFLEPLDISPSPEVSQTKGRSGEASTGRALSTFRPGLSHASGDWDLLPGAPIHYIHVPRLSIVCL